jgi:N-acetylmuramoyl-L-alanine amidase
VNIFLSLGHSMRKGGIITSANGVVNEYLYNKELIVLVRDYLVRAGHKVTLCMCPENQFESSAEERPYKINMENSGKYDLAVELHLNAYNGIANGCEVLYRNLGKAHAERVVAKLATVFKNRGAKKDDSLYFLAQTKAPAILVESFFCDNASDVEKGKDKKKIAKLIAEGIHGGTIAEATTATTTTTTTTSTTTQNTSGTIYRVQVGAYSIKANAEAKLQALKKAGFDGFITSSK